MTPLEAARRLSPWYEYGPDRICNGCGRTAPSHDAQCPWLRLPAIVAVLEAVERLIAPLTYTEAEEHAGVSAERIQVVDSTLYAALVAAMRGEKVELIPPSAGGCLGQCTEPHWGCEKAKA